MLDLARAALVVQEVEKYSSSKQKLYREKEVSRRILETKRP